MRDVIKAALVSVIPVCLILSATYADLIKDAKESQKRVEKKQLVFPPNSRTQYSNSGKIKEVILGGACEIQGIMWPEGTQIRFDEIEKIRRVFAQQPVTVEGITWPDGSSLSFTQSGRINWVFLGHAANIQGKSFNQYDRVRVDSDGKVHKVIRQRSPLTSGSSADF